MSGADASAEMEIFMKTERQRKILELIKKDEIGTQEELASALEAAGFNVTQATVSRDIRELNLTKTTIDGKQKYVVYHSHSSSYVRQVYKSAEGRLCCYGHGAEYSCD